MTTGIYALYWEIQDLIYIGQAQDIHIRYIQHISDMKNNTHSNYKIQETYHKYGKPTLFILEIAELSDLNMLEILWQKEFNSLESLDLIEAGQVGRGVYSNSSKYLKIDILKIFKFLYSSSYSYKEISEKLNIPKSLVQDIKRGASHLWLKERYPSLYKRMHKNSTTRYSANKPISSRLHGIKEVKCPEGIVYQISSITEFCKANISKVDATEHNFISGLGRVLTKERKSYKGWTLV